MQYKKKNKVLRKQCGNLCVLNHTIDRYYKRICKKGHENPKIKVDTCP